MKLHSLALAAFVMVAGGAAHADTYSANGSITFNDAVFNRPTTLTTLSAVGTAVHYDQLVIVGATPGPFDFRMQATPAGSFDTFLLLYSGLFNPASPLTGLVALNDDFGGSIAAGSGFSYPLAAGSLYTVISTTFSNTGAGDYITTVTTAVPEVGTYALMALGLAFVGAAVRRRSTHA
ncbi:MAG: hypothetical protein M3Y32_11345 [Pseudomonadota bacterium]|nr:hypothetical protein [Pseudomonadota bacterium]